MSGVWNENVLYEHIHHSLLINEVTLMLHWFYKNTCAMSMRPSKTYLAPVPQPLIDCIAKLPVNYNNLQEIVARA